MQAWWSLSADCGWRFFSGNFRKCLSCLFTRGSSPRKLSHMPEANELKYETEDFSPRAIRWFTAGLAALTLMVFVLMGWLLWVLSDGRPPGQGIAAPTLPAPNLSPAPDLQVAP